MNKRYLRSKFLFQSVGDIFEHLAGILFIKTRLTQRNDRKTLTEETIQILKSPEKINHEKTETVAENRPHNRGTKEKQPNAVP